MLNIIIVGAGGFGREVYEMLSACFSRHDFRCKGFLAREPVDLHERGVDLPVLADPEHYRPEANDRFVLAIGDMDARARTVLALERQGGQFLTMVHPRAHVASTAQIGHGAVIYPFAVVSNRAVIAPHVHLNYYASVGHDCHVGTCCLLAPYATLNGFAKLEDYVYVSTHATIAPGKTVGARAKISANTAVMQDVPPEIFVFGVPGKQTRRLEY